MRRETKWASMLLVPNVSRNVTALEQPAPLQLSCPFPGILTAENKLALVFIFVVVVEISGGFFVGTFWHFWL